MALDMSYPTALPSTKGWGPGFPNCQREKLVPLEIADRNGRLIRARSHEWFQGKHQEIDFPGGVHRDIHELLTMILEEMDERGFDFIDPGCWAFGCRGTKSSSGSQSTTPSFHSWGLAVDINAPQNPFGAAAPHPSLKEFEVPKLFASYGFIWLGPAIKDWMHFHFTGSPSDAEVMTKKARADLREDDMTEQQLAQLRANTAFRKGQTDADEAIKAGNPNPKPPEGRTEEYYDGFAIVKRAHKSGG